MSLGPAENLLPLVGVPVFGGLKRFPDADVHWAA